MVAERLQEEDSSLKYLVKWRGLPYSESTWESIEAIHGVGGQDAIDEFQVWHTRSHACARLSWRFATALGHQQAACPHLCSSHLWSRGHVCEATLFPE